ncbi:tyrosine-trna ligase [Cystoisospora suis]|uniref:Tyrosyl-tRNA synthetase n=1 Tax=Cystoisospora suis TaxID=483139 RepID=A0A2C6KLF8_9APIC|nr:tyrosine-trna ligase [Cystoisospora suis]
MKKINTMRKSDRNDRESSFSEEEREENCLREKGRLKRRRRKYLRVPRVLLSDRTCIEDRKSFRLFSSQIASLLFFLRPNLLSVSRSPPFSSSRTSFFSFSSRSNPYFRKRNTGVLDKDSRKASFSDHKYLSSSPHDQSVSRLSRICVPSFHSDIGNLSDYTTSVPRGVLDARGAARRFSSSSLPLHGRHGDTQDDGVGDDRHEVEKKEIEKGEEEEVKEETGRRRRRLEEGEEAGKRSEQDDVPLKPLPLPPSLCIDGLAAKEKEQEDEEKEKLRISKTIKRDRKINDTCPRAFESSSIDHTQARISRNIPFRSFFLHDLLERNLLVQGACLHQLDDLLIQWTNNYQRQLHYPSSSVCSPPSDSSSPIPSSYFSPSPSPSGGVSGEALEKSIDTFKQEEQRSPIQEPLSFYMGIDLTAGSLHAGHLLPLLLLKRLQESHAVRPVILLGSATTLVGDPSGKSEKTLSKKHKTEKPSSTTSPDRGGYDDKENSDDEQVFIPSKNLHSKHNEGSRAAGGEIENSLREDVKKREKKREAEDEKTEETNRGREGERVLFDENRHIVEDRYAFKDSTSSLQKISCGCFFDFERFLREGEDVSRAGTEAEKGGEKRRHRGGGKEEELWGNGRNEEERRRYETIEENKKVIIEQLRNIFSFSSSSRSSSPLSSSSLSSSSSSLSSRKGSQSDLSTFQNSSSCIDSSPSSLSFSSKVPSRQRCLPHARTPPSSPFPCSHTFPPPPALIVENSQWLSSVSCLSFLTKIASLIPVSHLLTRSTAQQNLQENGLPFSSLAYSLLQGLDWLELRRRFNVLGQVGGGDQWGNIATGLELARKKDNLHLFAVTTPLLLLSRIHQDTSLNDNSNKAATSQRSKNGEAERQSGRGEVWGGQGGGETAGEGGEEREKEDGNGRRRRAASMNQGEGGKEEGRKMGKSCGQGGKGGGGVVWLRREWTSPIQFWQYWRNVPDTDIKRMLRWFCLTPLEELEALEEEAEKNTDEKDGLNSLKEYLADHMTRLIHGEETLQSVKAVIAAARGGGRFKSRGETASSSMPVSSSDGNPCLGLLSPLPPTHLLKRSAVDSAMTTTLLSQESSHSSPLHLSSPRRPLTLSSLLVKLQLCSSRAAARRLAAQGGLIINHQKTDNPEVYIHVNKHFNVFTKKESSLRKTRRTFLQSLSSSTKEATEKGGDSYKAKTSKDENEKGILAIIHVGETGTQETRKGTKERGREEDRGEKKAAQDEEDREMKIHQSLICAGKKSFAVVEIVDDADWPQDKRHMDILTT